MSRGKAIISARLGKVTQGDEVEVLPAEVAAIQVPPSHNLKESESARLTATPTDRQGQPLRGREISWSSDRPQVVSVSDDGMITGRSGGSATVTATSEGRVGRVAVRVEAKPVPVAPPVVVRNDPPPIPTRDVGAEANTAARAAAAQQLSARPAEVLQAISTRDVNRAAALFSTEFAEDRRNAGGLRDKLSRPEAELKAADLQAGSPQMGDSDLTCNFVNNAYRARPRTKPVIGIFANRRHIEMCTLRRHTVSCECGVPCFGCNIDAMTKLHE